MTEWRRRLVEAPDPDAPRECRMTPEEGRRRAPAMSRAGDSRALWDDVAAYVEEEAVCCPFFTFGQQETADGIVLRVIAPPGAH